jgi:pimeloyl-ACP methyl ester carboxylesterase
VKFLTRSDGSRLRYLTAGTGPALVLLHTVRTQLDYFQRVIPLLSDSFTVYAVDLPGMGWSDVAPGAAYEEPDLRAAVVEFVNALDLHEVTLAGESLGAALLLSASIDLKDRVSRPILRGVMRGGFVDPGKLPEDFLAALRKSGRRKGYPKVARAIHRSLNGFIDARRRYSDVEAPVTLVYSERDWSRPTERDHVASLLAEVQRIALPDTGHFSALERPADFARTLLQRAPI